MNAKCRSSEVLCIGLLLFLLGAYSVRANVYATDIRVNGSLQAGVVAPGHPLTISYVLNDAATLGVTIAISQGTNPVASITGGTNIGLNTVVWNGTNTHGAYAAQGVCNVRITAAAAGYDTWTNITDDGTNFDVLVPTGIAVNKNTNSPYYGRVFVGNGGINGTTGNILKCNADGSPADEGGFGTGGYGWGGDGYVNPSPWKMDIGSDDRLYVEDWSGNGVVVSFDQVLSASYLEVLRPDNYPYSGISLSGLCVHGGGTNMQIFMADINMSYLGGMGILSWFLDGTGVAASNDPGTVDVTLTNNSDLTLAPYAVSLDTNDNIYTIQREGDTNSFDDYCNNVLCFPALTNGCLPDTMSLWQTGAYNPALINNYGIAVDPPAAFVAVASRGYGPDAEFLQDGGVSIFLAASGSLVTNLSQDPDGNTNQEMVDVAWDNAGNLYALDFSDSVWRIYSPPGSNQAATAAIPIIQVLDAITPPVLCMPAVSSGQLNFTLMGQSNVTYLVQQSPDLINWVSVATNYSPTPNRPVSMSAPGAQNFYRAVTSP